MLESIEYRRWCDGIDDTLFCPGIPGAGKTFLTSIVISDLVGRFGEDSETGVAYLYCNYKRHTEHTIENLLASVLKQLIQGHPPLCTEVESLYRKHRQKETQPSVSELRTELNVIASKLPRIFLLIDALDECVDPVRSQLLEEVSTLQDARKISVFATSRFIPEVTSEFHGKLSVEIRASNGDVRRYLQAHMREMPTCVRRSEALQETIISEITKAVDGM